MVLAVAEELLILGKAEPLVELNVVLVEGVKAIVVLRGRIRFTKGLG